MNERKILENFDSPFIVNLKYAFQDQKNWYLVTDLMTGGDLRYAIHQKKYHAQKFNAKFFIEKEAKFIISCLFLGLDYIHDFWVIHRDIKPENIVFDSEGYPRITDFGISRVFKENNSKENSGLALFYDILDFLKFYCCFNL